LVAVSKLQPVPLLQEAYDAGQRDFGENYVRFCEIFLAFGHILNKWNVDIGSGARGQSGIGFFVFSVDLICCFSSLLLFVSDRCRKTFNGISLVHCNQTKPSYLWASVLFLFLECRMIPEC
jgi:hypothetical protein